MHVSVVQNVLKLNDEIAAMNRQVLHNASLFTIDLIGAPGCGKTALLEKTLQELKGVRVGVIVGDLTTQRDADRMARFTEQVVQVNTGKGCHLEANHIKEALPHLDLGKLDLLIIENVGNLICPVGFDLGQDAKVGMFAISGGDDKAAKHPYIVMESAVLVLSKMDLLPYIPFDLELFRSDIRRLNPNVPLLELSATTGKGMEPWLKWLGERVKQAAPVA
ncbi:MAG: hydrogenase nickel incorporation protein HypB [Planctomycetota bacterium]|nr:hydrogenase nickel incorporation protein HypB [Planctomycetota bacterium]